MFFDPASGRTKTPPISWSGRASTPSIGALLLPVVVAAVVAVVVAVGVGHLAELLDGPRARSHA